MGMTALMATALLLTAAGAQEKPSRAEAEASAKKVKELQKERIAALQSAADLSMRLAQSARIDLREALEDRMALLKAELGAAKTESERIALYKKAVGSLKEYEALAQRRFEAGRTTDLDMLRIKARRLEIEIQLEQAKIKSGARGGGASPAPARPAPPPKPDGPAEQLKAPSKDPEPGRGAPRPR